MRQLIICLIGLTLFSLFLSCQKEISLEFGEPAKGTLQSDVGECLPKLVAGSYIANKAINDSNFIEVTVNVTTAGPYTIYTDSSNGYFFRGTGTFTTTGPATVRLKGSGRPENPGVNTFTVFFDASSCDVDVTVLPSGSTGGSAAFTLSGAPGACASMAVNGTYYKDTTLDARHNVVVQVNVTTVGTYAIATNAQNGYSFAAAGTFGTTGVQTVTLTGTGKPAATGTNNFTVTAGSSTCTFPVTVTTPTTSGGCTPPTVQGTYTAGTATTTANKIVVSHTYASAGSFTVSTNTVNGYSFGPANITATAGNNSITLNATGTPTTAGTNTFTIDFGDGTPACTFTVTVTSGTTPPPNTDYFPTTLNSWWSYDDGNGSDTFKMTNTGPVTISGNTFQRFVYSTAAGPFDTTFYRKDAATGFYYESVDTAGFGPDVTFSVSRLNILFLKNSLTTGASYTSDFNASITGIPTKVRFKYTCLNANATMTVNGKSFTNVYKIELQVQVEVAPGNFVDAGDPVEYNYARGIGLIRVTDQTDFQDIRNWLVN
jgi:hypothetical protein